MMTILGDNFFISLEKDFKKFKNSIRRKKKSNQVHEDTMAIASWICSARFAEPEFKYFGNEL